jgi:hypothetical protein
MLPRIRPATVALFRYIPEAATAMSLERACLAGIHKDITQQKPSAEY